MRLLVIEDEARIAQAIKRALQLHNYAVDTIGDADGGLAAAVDPDYDLVILDRMLPGSLSGTELCRQVRLAGVHTPILILTALGEIDDKVAGFKAGADDYLLKPFSMRELVVRVEVLLRRPARSLGASFLIAGLAVDVDSYEASRSGVPIVFSAREFKLLTYLLYNQGQVLSKDKIISHVWDGDSLIVPNTVETYVGYLRRKVDKAFPGDAPLIHTIRGFGYRLGTKP